MRSEVCCYARNRGVGGENALRHRRTADREPRLELCISIGRYEVAKRGPLCPECPPDELVIDKWRESRCGGKGKLDRLDTTSDIWPKVHRLTTTAGLTYNIFCLTSTLERDTSKLASQAAFDRRVTRSLQHFVCFRLYGASPRPSTDLGYEIWTAWYRSQSKKLKLRRNQVCHGNSINPISKLAMSLTTRSGKLRSL